MKIEVKSLLAEIAAKKGEIQLLESELAFLLAELKEINNNEYLSQV